MIRDPDHDTAKPLYRNEPMSRDRAYNVAIAWGLKHQRPIHPRPNGLGFDAVIPMEVLKTALEESGDLPRRTHHPVDEPEPPIYADQTT
jgi:hypothetical protein